MHVRILACVLGIWLLCTQPTRAYFTSYSLVSNITLETADWTAPISTLFFGSRPISESILNGTFTETGAGWSMIGDVRINEQTAVIGKSSGMLDENTISQTFLNTSKNLTFEYRVFSNESLPGFDDPCFTARLNNYVLIEVDCSDVNDTTDWRTYSVELADIPDNRLTLAFSAGNTGDAEGQSWAEVRRVSTSNVVGNTMQGYTIFAKDNSNVRTFVQSCNNDTLRIVTTFTLPYHEPCQSTYWGEDDDGNVESPIDVWLDIAETRETHLPGLTMTSEPTGETVLRLPAHEFSSTTLTIKDGTHTLHPEQYIQHQDQLYISAGTQLTGSLTVTAFDQHHNLITFTED